MFKRFSVGFAAGYVFGARAGQKRYEQITDLADRVVKMPGVSQLSERASEVFTPERGRQLWQSVADRARSMGSGDGESSQSDDDDEYYDDEDVVDDDGGDEDVVDGDEVDEDGGDDLAAHGQADGDDAVGEDDSGEDDSGEDDSGEEEDDGTRPHGGRIRSLASAALERGRVD